MTAKELHVVGSRLYWLDFETAIDLVSKCKVDVKSIITHKFSSEEAQKVFEIFDQKIRNAVKVLLKPS
ncbi:MAG: putative oxidoreductase [Candidatus Bathyarchaeota archaeon BA1]|nr:MAG: putative oxidoreductase [Candidatus Bathyarchaeota archaeon BA1]